MFDVDLFLNTLYNLPNVDDGCFYIFDTIDRLLCDGDFKTCDDILKKIDVNNLSTSLMRSFLCITESAKDKLPSRLSLFEKIKIKFTEIRGEDKMLRVIGRLE